jgi:hypothetical protein
MDPELPPAGWRPLSFDHLYPGVTKAVAGSPADLPGSRPWLSCPRFT